MQEGARLQERPLLQEKAQPQDKPPMTLLFKRLSFIRIIIVVCVCCLGWLHHVPEVTLHTFFAHACDLCVVLSDLKPNRRHMATIWYHTRCPYTREGPNYKTIPQRPCCLNLKVLYKREPDYKRQPYYKRRPKLQDKPPTTLLFKFKSLIEERTRLQERTLLQEKTPTARQAPNDLAVLKWASRGDLGALLQPEPGTAQNEPPEAVWEPFCYQSPEQFKMSLQRPSGNPFATRARNSSKWASRGYLGVISPPEPETVSRGHLGGNI